jgi:pyruvate dehydrogenase E1 component
VPNCLCYDPAFAYEIAVIIQEGIRRMYDDGESIFYYFTVMNENYAMPAMPENCADGILKGMYRLNTSENKQSKLRAQLFGSGAILNEALKAQKILDGKYGVAADVWSVTSYKELYRDGHACERWNRLHPENTPKVPYVTQCVQDAPGVFVAASDYLKVMPDSISRWFPRPLVSLGTDGFGRSESRAALRDFFEVDARHIALTTLRALAEEKQIKPELVGKAIKDLEINPEKDDPAIS